MLHQVEKVVFEVVEAANRDILVIGQVIEFFVYQSDCDDCLFFNFSSDQLFHFQVEFFSLFFQLVELLGRPVVAPPLKMHVVYFFVPDSPQNVAEMLAEKGKVQFLLVCFLKEDVGIIFGEVVYQQSIVQLSFDNCRIAFKEFLNWYVLVTSGS